MSSALLLVACFGSARVLAGDRIEDPANTATEHGRRVRTLVSREVAAGRHQAAWDGTNAEGGRIAGGVYLYRLQPGSFSATHRMVLLP